MDAISLILNSGVLVELGGSILRNILESLLVKSSEAERKYEEKSANIEDKFRDIRQATLEKLNQLQTRAMLHISEQTLLLQMTTKILELRIKVYEATNEHQLTLVSDVINQLESSQERYDLDKRFRNTVRLVAVVISVIAFVILFAGAIVSPRYGLTESYVVPILHIPLSVLMWSAVGSFTSLLYRFNRSSDTELQDPLRWLITRPITGIMMGTIAYLAIRIGFMAALSGNQVATGNSLTNGSNELIWLISFLVGFSDRFSDNVLRSLVGKFSGDENPDLLVTDRTRSRLNLAELLDSWGKKQDMPISSNDPIQPKTSDENVSGEDKNRKSNEMSSTPEG